MSTVLDALLFMLGCFALSGLIIWLWGGYVARAWAREEIRRKHVDRR